MNYILRKYHYFHTYYFYRNNVKTCAIFFSGDAFHSFQDLRILKQKLEIMWDLVTQYNRKIKAILMDNLAKKFPTHKILNFLI